MWRIREQAEKRFLSFILSQRFRFRELTQVKKRPLHTAGTQTRCCSGVSFFLLSFLFSEHSFLFTFLHRLRQCWTMSLCRLNNSNTQVMISRHIPARCPTAESSWGFEPKQGVAIPLPACLLTVTRWKSSTLNGWVVLLARWHPEA